LVYQQVYDPIAGSLVLSTLVAIIPIVVLFVLLAGIRMAAQWAALITLAVAIVIAVLVYRMPIGLALDSTLFGAAFGLFPIVWIVINAIFIYNVVVDTGHFDTIRNSLAGVSNDRRVQALMAGLGFEPIYAAALALLANTAPVAFGGFGIPILTAGAVSGLDPMALSQMVGRQTPFLALIIPGMLVTVMAGFRRMIEVLPVVAVSGIAFAATQFLVSNLLGPELADLLAALITVVAVLVLMSFWSPSSEWHFEHEPHSDERESFDTPPLGRTLYAWSPFIIIVALFLIVQIGPIKDAVSATQTAINFPNAVVSDTTGLPVVPWPGLDGNVAQTQPVVPKPTPYDAFFSTNWLSAAGTIIFIGDIIALAFLRVGPGRALRVYGQSLNQLKWAILTIVAVLGLGFLLNYSGMTFTLGLAAAATGLLFPFFAPIIGWLGVALTGSDTSSNALFANLQKVTAQQIGLSPNLTVGANSSGGVLGKMISPQNLAVGTSATGLQGKEGDLLRLVLKWSIGLTIVMSILVVLQAYVFKFMVP
jgi:lactate permease